MFEIPGDDPESPDMAKEITGIILHHHPMNSWWRDEYTGGNTPPDCASIDGKTGVMAETGECVDCSSCPMNQFGSDANGGKACKNMHRLYLLREGEMLPIIFNIPPTSLKPFKDYLAKRIVLKGKRAFQVVTKITLKKAQNAGGISYSQAAFAKAGDLNAEQIAGITGAIEMVKQIASVIPVNNDATASAPASGEFTEVSDVKDEELPL